MKELLDILTETALKPALLAVAVYISGRLSGAVIQFFREKEMDIVALRVVQAVEQIYYDLDGPAKFDVASEQLAEKLTSKGIKFTQMDIKYLIESVVAGFNINKAPLVIDVEDLELPTNDDDLNVIVE